MSHSYPSKGEHWNAFEKQKSVYKTEMVQRTARNQLPLRILDYGSGEYGTGRAAWECVVHATRHQLFLFDPLASIRLPVNENVHVIDSERFRGLAPVDIINLSYVLNCMPPEHAQDILSVLHTRFPDATVLIIDYTIGTRRGLLDLLQSDAERRYRRIMGEEEFARTRTQYAWKDFRALLRNAGIAMNGQSIVPLDTHAMRTAFIARPPSPIAQDCLGDPHDQESLLSLRSSCTLAGCSIIHP